MNLIDQVGVWLESLIPCVPVCWVVLVLMSADGCGHWGHGWGLCPWMRGHATPPGHVEGPGSEMHYTHGCRPITWQLLIGHKVMMAGNTTLMCTPSYLTIHTTLSLGKKTSSYTPAWPHTWWPNYTHHPDLKQDDLVNDITLTSGKMTSQCTSLTSGKMTLLCESHWSLMMMSHDLKSPTICSTDVLSNSKDNITALV